MRVSKLILGLALSASFASAAMAATAAKYDLSPASNTRYLADNAAKPGVKKTPDGLQYRIIKSGTGKMPQRVDDQVTVSYSGALITGKVFDATKPGKTATLTAGALIPGWIEALSMMREGDTWELVIPSGLGYGDAGAGGGTIPPNQTLVFTLTLVKVTPAQ